MTRTPGMGFEAGMGLDPSVATPLRRLAPDTDWEELRRQHRERGREIKLQRAAAGVNIRVFGDQARLPPGNQKGLRAGAQHSTDFFQAPLTPI